MNRTLFLLVCLSGCGSSFGQSKPAADTPKGLLSDTLPRWLRVGATIRGRWERPEGSSFVAGGADSYYLDRMRLSVAAGPLPWLKLFAEGQDTRAWGYSQGSAPASMRDPWELRQGYVELGGGESRGAFVRFGRQEVGLGAGRLVSPGEWGNTGKSFDLIRGSAYRKGMRFDFFAGSVVLTDGNRFDRHKAGEHFYGTYNVLTRLIPQSTVEPYLLVKTQMNVTPEIGAKGDAAIYTAGLRIFGKLPVGFDYSVEVAKQVGSYSGDGISALAGTYTLGWTYPAPRTRPRFSADYSHASGDSNPKDGRRRTFDMLYGSSQPYHSLTGQIGWRNLRDLRAGFDFAPLANCKVNLDYRDFRLASAQDGLYNSSGTQIALDRKATSTHVGQAVEGQIAYRFPKAITASAGLGKLFASDFLKQAGKGSFVYPFVTWTKRF